MRVKAIRPAGTADVYNMEVEGTHDFAVNCGIIVHNCFDQLRYVCMKNPIGPREVYHTVERPYSPLDADDEYKPSRYAFYQVY